MSNRFDELLEYWREDQQIDDLACVPAESTRSVALRDTIASLETLSRALAEVEALPRFTHVVRLDVSEGSYMQRNDIGHWVRYTDVVKFARHLLERPS